MTIVVAACGGDDKQRTSSAPAARPAQSAADVYGTYSRRVTRADLARTRSVRDEGGPNQETPPTGVYRLTIARGTTQDVLKATDPGDFVVAMDVTLDAQGSLRATSYVDPSQGAFCGPRIPATARYTYAVRGKQLVLHAKGDPCADRDSILTGTWTRG
jgi:alkanesulfonate monooxygenase SsuD/methylene tetrahydromethanopterin reductase-like flavin-dependent oxidoreductase (luciferase family)